MTEPLPPLLLIGCGRMGGAMLTGWVEQGLAPSYAVDPVAAAMPGITVVPSADLLPDDFAPAAMVLAVKPQQAAGLAVYRRYAGEALVLSIMAGRRLDGLAALLGRAAMVRAMPNTPAAVRQAITVACPGPGVSAVQRGLADRLLAAIGSVAWVEDEAMIDAVTAVSGSGPAYVFLLAELMERAAIEQGLPPDLARELARRTVSGSGALLAESREESADLRVAVTSPGGTTERALAVLMHEEAWPRAVSQAIAAAAIRSRELAS